MPSPRIAVVIVNFNGREHIGHCLESLQAQTLQPARTIVVDNASTDDSRELIQTDHPTVELVVLDENIGFAAANNLGARRARDCDWLALLNPDAFPERGWLEALVRAGAEHPEFAVVTSRLIQADSPELLDGTGDVYHVSGMAWRRDNGAAAAAVTPPRGEVFSACAAAALYRSDLFHEAGGFDESFFAYYEDSDLSFRLRLRGHRCLYEPEAVVRHVGYASAQAESPFHVYHSQRNMVWTWVKNMPAPLLLLYLPQHLLANMLSLGWYASRGRAAAALAAKRDALIGLPSVLASRRRVQRARSVGPRKLRRAMATGFGAYTTGFRRALVFERHRPPLRSLGRARIF